MAIVYVSHKPAQKSQDILGNLSSATSVSCQLSLLELSPISSAKWAAEQELQMPQTKPCTETDTFEHICFERGDRHKLWKVNTNSKMVVHSAVEIMLCLLAASEWWGKANSTQTFPWCKTVKVQHYPSALALHFWFFKPFWSHFKVAQNTKTVPSLCMWQGSTTGCSWTLTHLAASHTWGCTLRYCRAVQINKTHFKVSQTKFVFFLDV